MSLCVGPAQSSVYTIDVNDGVQTNFTNPAYVSTEISSKNPSVGDGLPTYEEAIGAVKTPTAPTLELVDEDVSTIGDDSGGGGRNRRHRRHRSHRHHSDRHNENSEPNATDSEPPRRHRHRRGFRKHLAKIKRRSHTETE